MDVTRLLNTGAAPAEAVPPAPSTMLDRFAHNRGNSSETGIAFTASEGLAPSSSCMTTASAQGACSRRPSPHRNRTPWDAGGFSLSLKSPARDDRNTAPMDTATTTTTTTTTGAPALAVPIGSPSATRSRPSMHRFSDSRSSFSSAYTNSSSSASSTTNDSVSHSRLSSLSTVSENPPLASLFAGVSLMEGPTSKEVVMATSHPRPSQLDEERPSGREQSPSDAILIPRAMSQDDEANDHLLSSNMRLHLHPLHAHNHPNTHGIISRLPGSPARRHKRAVSAPDFPSINESRFPAFGPIPEPTPSPSEHSEGTAMEEHDGQSSHGQSSPQPAIRHKLPTMNETGSPESNSGSGTGYSSDPLQSTYAMSSPQRPVISPMKFDASSYDHHGPQSGLSGHPDAHLYAQLSQNTEGTLAVADLPINFEVASACMYRGDCQTGSQLRKAISHIFGRNKLCTRMIPAGVWVHYCRKHYQRTRYRNGGEYPQRQIALVQEQIRRVQAWSDFNMQQNCTPVLKDWSLSVRKREQLRLDTKMAVAGKKRRYRNDDEEELDLDDDRAELNGTAVPDWVIEHLGDGYSTADIMNVVDHLKADIDEGRLQQIPDIEILPNIVSDVAVARRTTPKKPYTRRRSGSTATNGTGLAAGGHRRSQSVNAAGMTRHHSQTSSDEVSPAPPVSYFTARAPYAHEQEHPQTPQEKRQRVDSTESPGELDRQLAYGGRVQLAHRPAFSGIHESPAEVADHHYMHANGYVNGHPSGMQAYGGAMGGYYPQPPPPLPPQTATSVVPPPQHLAPGYGQPYRPNDYEERRGYYERRLHSNSAPNGPNGFGILPAPMPQRYERPSVAQLEESSYAMNAAAGRRSAAHQRSHSEAGFFHSPPVGGRYPPSGPGMSRSYQEQAGREPLLPAGPSGRPSHFDERFNSPNKNEWRGGAVNHQPQPQLPSHSYVYSNADGNGMYRFENVQLPPLQSAQTPAYSDHAGPGKHMRHQSSPAVTRMHPANMDAPNSSPAQGISPLQASTESK